jgi:hypothetical protein
MKLSKSQYIRGLNCHKSLWLNKNKPHLLENKDNTDNQNIHTGNEVGKLARELFSGGSLVEFDSKDFAGMITKTSELIKSGASVIYEASFSVGGIFVMVDILQKVGDKSENKWNIIEVKSTTSILDNKSKKIDRNYIDDVSIQYFAISQILDIDKIYISHLDNSYVFKDNLELDKLFKIVDVSSEVLKDQENCKNNVASIKKMLGKDCPQIEIGSYCNGCDFKPHCWKDIPKHSVFNLYRVGKKGFGLYKDGHITYKNLRDNKFKQKLTQTQKIQISSKTHIDKSILSEFIDDVKFPINFFDFETFQNAVPKFNKQSPYQQIPFQYSLHILAKDGTITHKEFLGNENCDPRTDLIKNMLKDITPNGTIMAFSQGFEKSVIKNLANFSTQDKNQLLSLNTRFMDLLLPFRKLGYYHPEFHGSFSIKSILPALFPKDDELDYKKLGCVQNGGDAMNIFANLCYEKDQKKVQEIRQDLLKYCHLDTLAMVRIWEKLLKVVE